VRRFLPRSLFIICAGIIIAAPWLAFLLGDPGVVPILQWLSVCILLGAATRIPEAMIQKELLFGRLSVIGILTEVGTVGMSIGLAVLQWGVWSLVYGAVFGAALNAVLAWLFLPSVSWLNVNRWDRGVARQMLKFGGRMVGSTSVYTFYSYIDNYVVGRMLGTDALGYYSRAFDLTSKTVDSANRTIGVVLFPSYAQVQDDKERLSRAYLKSLRMIGSITIPMALGLFAVADEFIPVLLGEAWRPAIPPLKVLTLMSLLKPLSSTTSALFISTGHPQYNLRAGLAVIATLIPGMLLLLPWGIVGVAYAVVIAHAVGLVYNVVQVQTILPGTVRAMAQAVLPAFAGAAVMALSVMALQAVMPALSFSGSKYFILGCLVAAGVVVYGTFFAVTQRPLLLELVELARTRRTRVNT
jgi:O-antigen/teichoic acid export membrane protein